MLKSMVVFLVFAFLFLVSCIDKEQCVKDYAEADEWMIQRTQMAGDNQEAIKQVYEAYLKKYKEIDARCKN